MRNKSIFLIYLFSITYAFSPLLAENSLQFKEDGRVWKFLEKKADGEQIYAPMDEAEKSGKETIIFQYIPADDFPLLIYYEKLMDLLNDNPDIRYDSNMIKVRDNYILFSWWGTDSTGKEVSRGLMKISKDAYGLKFFRYNENPDENGQQSEAVWEKILKKYTFFVAPSDVRYDISTSLDGRNWAEFGEGKYHKKFFIKGESPENASERLEADVFVRSEKTPYDFYHSAIKDLEIQHGKAVNSRVIFVNNDSIFFEWWFRDDPKGLHELYKINFLSKNLSASVKYSNKNSIQNRPVWEKIISGANVTVMYNYTVIPEEKTGS